MVRQRKLSKFGSDLPSVFFLALIASLSIWIVVAIVAMSLDLFAPGVRV